MADTDLIKLILAIPAETRTVEFKRLGQSRNESVDRSLESIVAMANTDGGALILGVADPEKCKGKGADRIHGIEENLALFDELGRAVRKINPPLANLWPPRLIDVLERKRRIGLLQVPKATDQFRAIENHVFVRLERGNKRLSPQEIVHFSYIKGFARADCELVEVELSLLQTPFYEAWRKNRGVTGDSIGEVLRKTGLARTDDKGALKATRAAVLLFAEFPGDLLETKCIVRVFQYDGNDIESRGDTLNLLGPPKNLHGPAIKLIADASDYVLNLLKTGLRVSSGFVTQYKIPERAIREAITNAVIHRDYGTKRDIEIRVFENRVEIESPGLLPFNITPSNIGFERALGYRNDLMVKHLREFPDPPNLDQNEGVRLMRDKMHQAKLYPPVFITYPELKDSIRVVLLNTSAPSEWDKVKHILQRQKYVGNAEVRTVLNLTDSVKTSKLLAHWVRQGLLVKISSHPGAKKNVRYRLPETEEATLFSGSRYK